MHVYIICLLSATTILNFFKYIYVKMHFCTWIKSIEHNFQFAADYATKHLMKNLINKVIEVKKLHNKDNTIDNEPSVVISNTPNNLTPQMKTKLNQIESQSPTKTKLNISADDSIINHNKLKQDLLRLKKDEMSSKMIEDVTINPLSYLLRDGTINFSKLLIDEVLAADKLLIEAAKLTYDIAGSILNHFYLIVLI